MAGLHELLLSPQNRLIEDLNGKPLVPGRAQLHLAVRTFPKLLEDSVLVNRAAALGIAVLHNLSSCVVESLAFFSHLT
jgi:hypothetical protein